MMSVLPEAALFLKHMGDQLIDIGSTYGLYMKEVTSTAGLRNRLKKV